MELGLACLGLGKWIVSLGLGFTNEMGMGFRFEQDIGNGIRLKSRLENGMRTPFQDPLFGSSSGMLNIENSV